MIAALTDHLWQSTLFVLAATLVAAALRQNGAHIRHRIWLIASMKFVVPLSLLMAVGSALPGTATEATGATPVRAELAATIELIAVPFTSESAFLPAIAATQTGASSLPLIIGAVWVAGFAAVVGMRVRGWRRVRSAVRASRPMPIEAPIPVRSSPGLLEPGIVGFWRPVLLVPEGIQDRLAPNQFAAVLLHELCHARRRDNLTSAFHMVVEAVFWFHPLVWFVGARLVDERERACDEYVLRTAADPAAYAESIVNVCKLYVESPITCVSGVTGSDLKQRVAAIMVNRIGCQLSFVRKSALVIAGILAFCLPILAGTIVAPASATGQAAAQFDVVSIKPCVPNRPPVAPAAPAGFRRGGAPWHATVSPGYAYWDCVTLAQLVDQAYADQDHPLLNVVANPRQDFLNQPKRVRGGPAWVETEKYTIEAKAPVALTHPGAASATGSRTLPVLPVAMSQALRAVLEDRFKLRVSREKEEQSMYALVLAKAGLNAQQITVSVPGDCMTSAEYSAAVANGTAPALEELRMCGRYYVSRESMRFSSFTLAQLAKELSGMMDHYVLDRTGTDAKYNFTLKLVAGDAPPDLRFSRALEPLGLRLEPTKGPAEFLRIERAERPTPNSPAYQ
jgi:bla regulator protein BlaR1